MHSVTFPFFLQFPFLLLSLQSLPFFVSFFFSFLLLFSPFFPLLFLPILPYFLHSVPFFSSSSLLFCFHSHSVPTNSPFVCRTVPRLFNESHTNCTFFMLAVRATLTAKFTKYQDDILFASQLASFLICCPRTPPCHTFHVLVISPKIRNSLRRIEQFVICRSDQTCLNNKQPQVQVKTMSVDRRSCVILYRRV